MYECIKRVVRDCKITFKRYLFLRQSEEVERELRISLGNDIVELANDGHGERRASREAGDGAHYGRE